MASHTSTSSVTPSVGSRLWIVSGPSTTLAVNDFVRCSWNDGAGRVGFLEGQITTINSLSITVNCLSRTVVSGTTLGNVSNWTIRQINPAVGAEMITSGTLPLARIPAGVAAATFSNTEPITASTAASEQGRLIFTDLAPSETTSIRHRFIWVDSEGNTGGTPDVLDIKPLRGLSFASDYGFSIPASEVRASWRASLGLGGAAIANIGSGASEVSAGNHTHSIYTRRVGPGQIQHRVNSTFNASGYVSGITATSTPANFGFYQIAQTGNFLFNPAEVFGVNTTFRIRLMVRRSPGANATLRVLLRSNRVGRGEEGVPGLLDNAITGTNEVGSWVSSDISTGNGFYETYEIYYSVPSGNGGSNIQDATLWFEQV